ncbi:MAG: bis(5'-nucleosyl)-tetraphosphatase (symmetrical) YqeK [Firmicutes bacterium]|nr:bis(5'-nucleosyl)-tetraphosphatase (symmetrical) YqeK [Bacillota bacterium]
MKNTVIFGGSFDPPHKGHLEIIRHLQGVFDRVLVMPAFVSPFKQGKEYASSADRLNMLRILIQENGLSAEISTFELSKQGVSYSADTIRYYNEQESGGANLCFAIGSESLPALRLWKDAEYLKQNVTFYVIPRQGYDISAAPVGFNVKIAPIIVPDYSSAFFKAARAFNREKDIVTEGVYDYIDKNGLYDQYKCFTDGFAVFKMRKERIDHTYGAVKAGITLTKIHGEDVDKTIIALILHDIGKYANDETLKSANVTPPDTQGVPIDCRHAIIGREIARQYFGITDSDVLDAIYYHTTGRPDMGRLEKIVAVADYIEEGRAFEEAEVIARLAKTDLDGAMAKMLANVIRYLRGANKEIFEITFHALSFYHGLAYNK